MTLYFWCDPGYHRIRTKEKTDSSRDVSIYCPQHKFQMRLLGSDYIGKNEWLKLQNKEGEKIRWQTKNNSKKNQER